MKRVNSRLGLLYLVSGPAGSGKTTLCRRLAADSEAIYATSATTRAPRAGEKDGEDYFFMTKETFLEHIHNSSFLEHAEVHGNYYGTLKSEVLEHLESGKDVVMDIDVQGAATVRDCADPLLQASILDLFVMPPSEEELYSRLVGRGTDSGETISLRMNNALEEMKRCDEYTYCLVSGSKEDDYEQFLSLLKGQRLRRALLSL